MGYAEAGFWICFGWLLYVYAGYAALAFLLAPLLGRRVRKADVEPSACVVIAAYNEEREIRDTVENKLAQDYPRLEMIVVSDGSNDRTDEIVRDLAGRSEGRLRLLRQEPRQGKTQ